MVNASSTSTACHAGTGKTFPDLSSALSIRGDDIRLIINVPIFIQWDFFRPVDGRDRSCNCHVPVPGELYRKIFPGLPELIF
jgi:hypothetical protein